MTRKGKLNHLPALNLVFTSLAKDTRGLGCLHMLRCLSQPCIGAYVCAFNLKNKQTKTLIVLFLTNACYCGGLNLCNSQTSYQPLKPQVG